MKALTFILFFLLLTIQVFSQNVSQQWVSRFNGTANSTDYSYALTLDPSSNVIVTGYSTNTNTSKDMTTVKYDNSGNLIWSRTFDGPNHGGDYSFAIASDMNGNIYVTGRCDGGATNADITTLAYSSSGVPLWNAVYDGPAHAFDEARCIAVDNSGNVYVSGSSMSVSNSQDIVLIKYNSAGVQQWVQTYNGPGNGYDVTTAMQVDGSSNIYLTGGSIGATSGYDYVTIKYSSDGVPLWVNTYNGPANGGDVAYDLKLDGSGNVYVTGQSDGGSTGVDYATIKYSPAGVQQWVQRYNSSYNGGDFANAMAVTSAGDVYVTGSTSSVIANDSNYATVKYNTNGVFQWVQFYFGPGSSNDVPRAISLDDAGNVYVSGSSNLVATSNDYTTIKYDPMGDKLWAWTYNGPANSSDYATSIAVDHQGDVFVTGRSMGTISGFDFATVKYSPLVGIQPVSNQTPTKFSLMQNYPNPFNPTTKIKFDLPVSSTVGIQIYNIEGKTVLNPYSGSLSPGSYEYSVDASSLSSGIYFYRITANGFTDTKKMALVK